MVVKNTAGDDGIIVRNQPRMGLIRIILLTLWALRYRLLRAVVTLSVVAVAIAFLINVLVYEKGLVTGIRAISSDLGEARTVKTFSAWMSGPASFLDLIGVLSVDHINSFMAEEVGDLCHYFGMDFEQTKSRAVSTLKYMTYFSGLGYQERKQLGIVRSPEALLDELSFLRSGNRLVSRLESMRELKIPGGRPQFIQFIENWSAVKSDMDTILQAHNRIVAALHERWKDQGSILRAFAESPDEIYPLLRSFQVEFPVPFIMRLKDDAMRDANVLDFETSLGRVEVRLFFARRSGKPGEEIDRLIFWENLQNPDEADNFLRSGLCASMPIDFDNHAIVTMAVRELRLLRLAQRLEKWSLILERNDVISGRTIVLLVLALIVATVGIANAMFMAVAERFREIATLKCLGALDGSIMSLFVVEAFMIGLFGSILGLILGFGIAAFRLFTALGSETGYALSNINLLQVASYGLLLGAVLAAGASILPALRAARMAPMEAMRVE